MNSNNEREWIFEDSISFEKYPNLDIALIKLEEPIERVFIPKCSNVDLNLLDSVFTGGYPYALDIENKVINVRAFKGHIIGTGKQIFNDLSYKSYELSFNVPRGLSGSPLLKIINDETLICGIIIANRSHEMEVLSMKEKDSVNGKETVYSKIECMNIGVAIQMSEIKNCYFNIIQSTIGDFLK